MTDHGLQMNAKFHFNENRIDLNITKKKYKCIGNKLKRRYEYLRGNMLDLLKKTIPKRFYKKLKTKMKIAC